MTTRQYVWEDLETGSYGNIELGTTHGYIFPCGRKLPSEFFTKNEALENHNGNRCFRCERLDAIYSTDLRTVQDKQKKELMKSMRAIKERLETIVSITALIQEDGTQCEEYKTLSKNLLEQEQIFLGAYTD